MNAHALARELFEFMRSQIKHLCGAIKIDLFSINSSHLWLSY